MLFLLYRKFFLEFPHTAKAGKRALYFVYTYGKTCNCYSVIKKETISVSSKERVMGIEPTYPAWKAGVLPLNYTRIYYHENHEMPGSGIEPETRGFSVLCSTN